MRGSLYNLRGFTLAESLTASVVLAIAVVGISTSLSASYQQSAVQEDSATALDLARELMEEVSAKPFEVTGTNASGWPTVTDRTLYDTIDDYNGYTDNSSTIKMYSGTTIDVGNGGAFTRSVSVTNTVPTGLTGTASDFAVVTVTVKTPHADAVTLTQLCMKSTLVRGQ
jgi:prepilin-type N-terminal cleavage/methylation domain-containing protein